MKKILESIQRRFDEALIDFASNDEMKSAAGKVCCYQLAAVRGLIEERIVCCKDCLSYESLQELVRNGSIDEVTAEAEQRLGKTGMCLAGITEKFICDYDYCSDGVRRTGRE